jgi:hypothetical protein
MMDWGEFERLLEGMRPWDVFVAGFTAGRGDSLRFTDPYVADVDGSFVTVDRERAERICGAVWKDGGFAEAVLNGTVEAPEELVCAVRIDKEGGE